MPQILLGVSSVLDVRWHQGGAGVTHDGDLGSALEDQSLQGEDTSRGKKMLVAQHWIFACNILRVGSGYFFLFFSIKKFGGGHSRNKSN